ncbi:germin-like protein subfamily 1 member 17 [Mangifera indica]|uniref:germin-like protein subfamily 1 member 17 n=1 Tax=Mangifera indica TaxID=29780 RepID=UPI001CFC298E|nr:germin-like protein subfamily 1 member 17 [Mangifera indica]
MEDRGPFPFIKLELIQALTSLITMKNFLLAFVLLASISSFASAFDPEPLQDFCVAINDPLHGVFVNGKFCQDPNLAKAENFSFSVKMPGSTNNLLGSNVTAVTVDQIPGLNTLGISAARLDFAPYGEVSPHTHPRATEILVVLEGTLLVGFITSDSNHTLFTKVLNQGDVFVFPIGLIHFQVNIGKTNALAFSSLNSQNPGVITIASTVFGSNPPIKPKILARAFMLDVNVVKTLQRKFQMMN